MITNKALAAAAVPAGAVNWTLFEDGIEHTRRGSSRSTSFGEVAQFLEVAASSPWPTAAQLVECTARINAHLSGEDAAENFDAAVREAKHGLPVVVWAKLAEGTRADRCVEAVSCLFIDLDKSVQIEQVAELRKLLISANINHVCVESATSALKQHDDTTKDRRFHCHVQIKPISPTKQAWQTLYARVVAALAAAAGVESFDPTVDDLAQPIFGPNTPPGSPPRQLRKLTDGQALDLEAFVRALDETEQAEQPPAVGAVSVAAGPTPGESTGSLLLKAFRHLGRVGNLLDAATKKYAAQCPWCDSHKSDPRQKMGHFKNDTSTVIYDDVGKFGRDGGFECKHEGSGADGECKKATAADVLRWARKRIGDDPAVLPNRPEWGGVVVEVENGDDGVAPQPSATRRKDTRPTIIVRVSDVAGMRDQAIAALSKRCDVFVRDGALVDLTPAGTRTMPADHLLAVLGESARWVARSRSAEDAVVEKPAKVPREVVGAVLKAPHWPGVAELRAVVKHPPLLPDGRLIVQPGYDAESRLLYLPDTEFNVPSAPTRDDALAAASRLLNYVRNTNFCDASGPSVWLSFLLTLTGRTAVPTVPIVGFDAAVAGAGKTSLVKIAYGLVFGELPDLGAPVVDDDAEAEKRLPTWARQALVCWDNVKHTFSSPVVDGAITAGKATTRRLGANEALTFHFWWTAWAMTGNNLIIGDDAASRCIVARIQAPTNRRYDFAVDDVAFYRAHRPRAVADALTILRAFVSAGMPQRDGLSYCRFVEWSRLIRGAILWLGMADPVGAEVADSSLESKAEAMRALYRVFGCEAFHASDIDTSPLRGKVEDDVSYRLRRGVVDALECVFGRVVKGAKVGNALQKLRDATAPLVAGDGTVRFVVGKEGAKSVYQLVMEGVVG